MKVAPAFASTTSCLMNSYFKLTWVDQ